ncbi:serine protease [Streptomyces sp. NPDC050610]|uniref:trypsin-like serine peptidase n=1 Tax=Streptomyces sp. NPDC050610 TaxID=3157097 RepID=UPI0034331D32
MPLDASTSDTSARPRTGRRRRLAAVGAAFCVLAAVAATGVALKHQERARAELLAPGDAAGGRWSADAERGDGVADEVRAGLKGEGTTDTSAPTRPEVADLAKAAPSPLPASDPLAAAPTGPRPTIGPLFYAGVPGGPDHQCTAAVVHSPRGNLLVTAAHCVYQGGFRTDLAFVPGYHDGLMPYGVWVPTRIDLDPRWTADRDPDHDVAFVQVRRPGAGKARIESTTAAEQIRFNPPPSRPTRLVGYPYDQERPISCQNATNPFSPTQLSLICPGFPSGTSGGPMLTDLDPNTGRGTVTGVLGGYDEGGDDTTSYSTYFGDDVAGLYRRATTA